MPYTRTLKASLLMAVFALVSVLSPLARPATAQEVCVLRDVAFQQLEQRYGEHPVGRGLARAGKTMVELLTSDRGTWTIVVTNVKGETCVLASGEAWTEAEVRRGEPS